MSDTIVAIATALSPSGIGIIRLSGEDAVKIADEIFVKPNHEKLKDQPTHTIHYGHIAEKNDGEEKIIDEVMVLLMRAPHSFTREDVVEIDCHGGVYLLKRILMLAIKAGARLADPGEFTKRAFLNGRIDLSEAEAVMDLISSGNESARKNSMGQLSGRLSEIIILLREKILFEIAFIEAAIDDPEHYDTLDLKNRLSGITDEITDSLIRLKNSFDNGKMLINGIQTTIVGKPNVGKSSFLNLLLGEERAIVTSVAGTTRDTLEENISLDGVSLHLIDTAGIHETTDVVESIGVKKAKESLENAELVIFVLDSSDDLSEEDRYLVPLLQNKNVIAILNKSDLSSENPKITEADITDLFKECSPLHLKVIPFSAKTAEGLDVLSDYIKEIFFEGKINTDEEIYLTSLRHKNLVEDALLAIGKVKESLAMDMPEDFYSIDLMQCYSSLGAIIGEEVDDDLVDEIFSKFCMGK
ncbi:MAG: tRNA uridine-5-carboxymethylaminomethyl(34) synthesis GTPase MnmE [Lachnospiraceae bacterium]|nr:tRNA uridine-5-carboxymethylaminomethyl(34) synthesis GTPase MnmE [Lachnospiraceae bacterium]